MFAGQPKASKGGCLLVGLVPPEAGKFPAVGDFVQWRRGRGAGRKKGEQLVLVPLEPGPVLSSDTLLGQSHL